MLAATQAYAKEPRIILVLVIVIMIDDRLIDG